MGDLVTGVVGIAGVLLGLFADRLLQRQGKVRCVIESIELYVIATKETEASVRTLPLPDGMLDVKMAEDLRFENEPARCFVEAELFNEKEVKTGIRNVMVVFEGRETVEQKMFDRRTWQPPNPSIIREQMDFLELVNLPSREWVALSLVGEIKLEDARKLTRCDKAWLRGYFPDGRRFNERIPFAE